MKINNGTHETRWCLFDIVDEVLWVIYSVTSEYIKYQTRDLMSSALCELIKMQLVEDKMTFIQEKSKLLKEVHDGCSRMKYCFFSWQVANLKVGGQEMGFGMLPFSSVQEISIHVSVYEEYCIICSVDLNHSSSRRKL